jgi:CheY-like chemotaxis protein/DNA-binding XRE family transcriptional regulator
VFSQLQDFVTGKFDAPRFNVQKIFGASVKARRNQLGFSQGELAERADLHRTYVSDIERGARNISLQSIAKLASALAISVSALFPETEFLKEKTNTINGSNVVEILLMEDNDADVKLTLHAFKKARFTNRVHVIGDGAEALDFVFCRNNYAHRSSETRPQVILLDLDLPKIGGLEVLRQLKAEKRIRKIPVVVLAVSQRSQDIAECRRLGAETCIVKPVNFQNLSQATPQLNLNWALLKPAATNG